MPEPKLYDPVRCATLHGTVVKDAGPRGGHYRRHVDGPASPVVKLRVMESSWKGHDALRSGLFLAMLGRACMCFARWERESTGAVSSRVALNDRSLDGTKMRRAQ